MMYSGSIESSTSDDESILAWRLAEADSRHQNEREELEVKTERLSGRVRELEAELDVARLRADEAEMSARLAVQELERLRSSASWKVTAGLRWGTDILRRARRG